MRACAVVLALLASCGLHLSVHGQEPAGTPVVDAAVPSEVIAAPDAVPGAVISAVLRILRPAGAASATYRVQPAEQVLLYGAPAGNVTVRADGALLPLTFSVPKETVAGVMHVAHVEVHWDDGTAWATDVATRVVVRRGVELELDTTSVFAARGSTSHLRLIVRNTGNAADTIRLAILKPEQWTIETPAPLVVAAGASHGDSLRIRVPETAVYGETQVLRVMARGAGSEAAMNLAVTVAEQGIEAGGLLRIPATITVGAVDAGMLDETPVSLALEMQGSLGGGTEASLLMRRSPDAATPPAFYQYLTGPSLRAEVRNGQNHATAGDVLVTGSPLHGGSVLGTGVDASGVLGPLRASAFAARPHQFDEPGRPGHLFGADAELSTRIGTVGVSASDMARPVGILGETERSRLAALTFRGTPAEGLTTRAEAGIMTLRDDDGRTREGIAFDIGSAWHSARLDLQAHVRRVPGALATSGSAIDETYVSGAVDVGHGFALNGWLVRNESELLNGGGSQRDGSALTVRWQEGGATAQVSGYLRRTRGSGLLTGDAAQRSLAFGGSVPLGPLMAEGTVEIGRTSSRDTDRPLRHITSRLAWQANAAWAWLGLSHSSGVFGSDLTRVDAGSTVRAGRIELDARVGTWLGNDAGSRADAWLSTTLHVTPQTALIAGIDYAPWRVTSDDVRVSLGARHSLGVPLPLRRRPQVHGVIFEDMNGNLQRDPPEPGIQEVRVRRGNTFAVTDRNGRYAFYGARSAPRELSVDAGSLAHGLMLLPTDGITARGSVDVPVVRAAALRLFVFEDRDRDGLRGMFEAAAAGAVIELTDARGRTRTASTDQRGHVAFAALVPGDYSVRARIATGQQEAGAAGSFTLLPGEATLVEIGAPKLVREIRFGMPADTARVDTVTVISPDGTSDEPVRSDESTDQAPSAAKPARVTRAAPDSTAALIKVLRQKEPTPRPARTPPAVHQLPRTGRAIASGWMVAGALLMTLWVRRRRA